MTPYRTDSVPFFVLMNSATKCYSKTGAPRGSIGIFVEVSSFSMIINSIGNSRVLEGFFEGEVCSTGG